MSVVVTGASGMLGSAVLARCGGSSQASGWQLRGEASEPSLRQVDITDADAVDAAFDDLAPALCVHCAAIADVDRCEAEPELAEAVNVRGTANVAAAAARHSARLILISSDYVFDGRPKRPIQRTPSLIRCRSTARASVPPSWSSSSLRMAWWRDSRSSTASMRIMDGSSRLGRICWHVTRYKRTHFRYANRHWSTTWLS